MNGKIVINVYTTKSNSRIYISSIECLDGNHRLAAGFFSGCWNIIGDIPYRLLDVRVNGFDTFGHKKPRWIPKHIAEVSDLKWTKVISKYAKGPTAQIAGDISSINSRFPKEYQGVKINRVIMTSLDRVIKTLHK